MVDFRNGDIEMVEAGGIERAAKPSGFHVPRDQATEELDAPPEGQPLNKTIRAPSIADACLLLSDSDKPIFLGIKAAKDTAVRASAIQAHLGGHDAVVDEPLRHPVLPRFVTFYLERESIRARRRHDHGNREVSRYCLSDLVGRWPGRTNRTAGRR